MNAHISKKTLSAVYHQYRKPLRIGVLVLGFGVAALFVNSLRIDAGWLKIGGWGALMALFEVTWLSMSPAGLEGIKKQTPRKSTPGWHVYAWGGATFLVLALVIPVSLLLDTTSGSEPEIPALAGLVLALLLTVSVFFVVHLWGALIRARDGQALSVKYLFRPGSGLVRFESWYVISGSIVYGVATGMVIGGEFRVAFLVLIISGLLIQASCVVFIRLWVRMGDAMRDASKFLLRQSILTVFLCLGLVLQAQNIFTDLTTTVVTAATLMLLINAAEVAMLWMRWRSQQKQINSNQIPSRRPDDPQSHFDACCCRQQHDSSDSPQVTAE